MSLISSKKVVHLPGLNGLRAIAAMGVILSHITTSALPELGLNPHIFGTQKDGNAIGLLLASFGVTIFFALSGFLITYLLLKEKEVQQINVKHFYFRRILRIWPVYYLYIILSFIAILSFAISFDWRLVPCYIFIAANIPYIMHLGIPLLEHYWSLGVEEQFYVFWPWIAKKENKQLLKWTIGGLILLIGLKFIFKFVALKFNNETPYLVIHYTRFQCMMIGALGAIFYYANNQRFISFATNIFTQLACWIVILIITINKFHISSIIDHEIVSAVTVCIILGQVTKRNRLINLDNGLCNFLGKISYGLYVYHLLIIFLITKILLSLRINSTGTGMYILVFSSIIAITILVAFLSYQFYEKRFLKMKHGFSAIKSSSTSEEVSDTLKVERVRVPVEN